MYNVRKAIFLIAILGLLAISCGEKVYYVDIETEYGNMKAELYNSTPIHRDNFVKLVKEGFYDDLLFHRIIDGFMIQGGDPNSKNAAPGQSLGSGGPGYTIDNEIGAPHFRGCLAAARTGGPSNPEKKSSGSQFYIVDGNKQNRNTLNTIAQRGKFAYNEDQISKYEEIGGTPMLDNDYTVFGELISGHEVIDQIATVAKDQSDRPVKDVKMKIRMSTK